MYLAHLRYNQTVERPLIRTVSLIVNNVVYSQWYAFVCLLGYLLYVVNLKLNVVMQDETIVWGKAILQNYISEITKFHNKLKGGKMAVS